MRPKADSLGEKVAQYRGLTGRERALPEPARETLAALQAAGLRGLCGPRASAFGLGPGLGSPGPLGRNTDDVISPQALRCRGYAGHSGLVRD